MLGSASVPRPAGQDTAEARRRPARWSATGLLDAPIAAAIVGCAALALASVLVLSWVPSSDPWAWIDWGQEIASRVATPKIAFALAGGPSWKPFPVVFTSVFGLFGGAGPTLWLLLTRTAGLLALLAAFRLGRRFAGPVAGIVAVIALCLVQDWLFYLARGASEPVVAALTLWAIDRHLSGSPRVAYGLAFLATMNRPEFTPLLALYALYLWLRVPGSRPLAVGLLVLVPVAWLLPPWAISGNPLQAGSAAAAGKGSPGTAIAELRSSTALMTWPTLALATIGLGFAWRRHERTLLWLGAGAIAWALMVAVVTQVFYGLPRYLLPAGAIACVLAGVGVVRLGQAGGALVAGAGLRAGSRAGAGGDAVLARADSPAIARRAAWPVLAAGAIVLALTLPWTIPRIGALAKQSRDADLAAHFQQRLFAAVEKGGGARTVLPCRSSHVAVNHSLASVLAWKLRVPLRRVRPLMEGTGFVFSAPRNRDTGSAPPIVRAAADRVRVVVQAPPWTVLEVTRASASSTPHCAHGDAAHT